MSSPGTLTSRVAAVSARAGLRARTTARHKSSSILAPGWAVCSRCISSTSPLNYPSPLFSSPFPFPSSSPSSAYKALSPALFPRFTQVRHSSYSLPPQNGPASTPKRKKVTIQTINSLYARGEPITMVTAYDYPTGLAADAAGIDTVLVGDSCAMVALGMPDTTEIGMDEMIIHTRAVSRAVQYAFIIADLPFGSYEASPTEALQSAITLMKHGRAQAVKLEGGRSMAPTISHIVHSGGIPVLAHIGLTPQRLHALGGFRSQGRTADAALRLLDDALAVQEAGAFAVVIEAVPASVAAEISARLRIPTIGIGAGSGCGGQVLVQADMCGALPNVNYHISSTRPPADGSTPSSAPTEVHPAPPPSHLPKFVRQYGNVWNESVSAMRQYREDVKSRAFPAREHEYSIADGELSEFLARLGGSGLSHHHRHHPQMTTKEHMRVGKN